MVYECFTTNRKGMQRSKDSQSEASENKEDASEVELHCNASVKKVDG